MRARRMSRFGPMLELGAPFCRILHLWLLRSAHRNRQARLGSHRWRTVLIYPVGARRNRKRADGGIARPKNSHHPGPCVPSGARIHCRKSFDTWLAALNHYETLPFTHVLPGHGIPGGPELYEHMRNYLVTARDLLSKSNDGDDFAGGKRNRF
jgi:hypothetical protein